MRCRRPVFDWRSPPDHAPIVVVVAGLLSALVSVGSRVLLFAAFVGSLIGGSGCSASSGGDGESGTGSAIRLAYGDHDDAFGELWLPELSEQGDRAPVVVLIHGGFWREGFRLDLMDPLISSLLERGYVVWNIEYRRVGSGGGYPSTFEDVASAVDRLATLSDAVSRSIDLDRVAVVGHSAGGHLAAWAAARPVLAHGSVGADPSVRPAVAVAQAGVLDLIGCAEQGVGGTACLDLIGASPDTDPARYAATSPMEMVPFDAVVVAVHGDLDRIVPDSQSVDFVARAQAVGMVASFQSIAGADHFSNLDPRHSAWSAVLDALDRHL